MPQVWVMSALCPSIVHGFIHLYDGHEAEGMVRTFTFNGHWLLQPKEPPTTCVRGAPPLLLFQQPFLDYGAKESRVWYDKSSAWSMMAAMEKKGVTSSSRPAWSVHWVLGQQRHLTCSSLPALPYGGPLAPLFSSCIWFIAPSVVEQSLEESWSEKVVCKPEVGGDLWLSDGQHR